jgi:hypothetical protein
MPDKLDEYILGQQVLTELIIYDADGAEATPTGVALLWGKLLGDLVQTPTTWTLGQDAQLTGSASRYTAIFQPTDDGLWQYRYEWSGAYVGAVEKTIRVRKSGFYV